MTHPKLQDGLKTPQDVTTHSSNEGDIDLPERLVKQK
jgi:hypothetical protein